MASIDIFIKSYKDDFWLLYYALASIERNVTGYSNVILVIPEKDKELFDTRELPLRTLIHYVPEFGSGYLFQQYCKLQAHNYSSADYILFGDSDCFFDRPIDLQGFVADGRPEILYTSWDKVDQAIIWRQPTEAIIGAPVEFEYMRRNTLIYHRSSLENLNKWEPNLKMLIMGADKFSEFNLLGAFVFKFEKEKYRFINTDDWEYVDPKATQLWSHCSKREGVSELHLREYIRTLETIMKVHNVHVP